MHHMKRSEMSDEALLHATRSDPDAFAEFYDRYESALVGYLLRRAGNIEVAVDLASEVFAAALAGAVALLQLNGLTVQNLELRQDALRRFFSQGSGTACRLTLAVYRLPAETHMLWLAPDGKVVRHTLIRFSVYVGTHHPAPGTVPLPRQCGSSG
jgi:hypothetical protein